MAKGLENEKRIEVCRCTHLQRRPLLEDRPRRGEKEEDID